MKCSPLMFATSNNKNVRLQEERLDILTRSSSKENRKKCTLDIEVL